MVAYWLNEDSRTFLSRGYLAEGQTAEGRIRVIAETAERILDKPGFADKFERYMLNGWISLASPVWSNFGTDRGLPISCNGSYLEDTTESILLKTAEIGMMTKHGAGTSAYFGALRGRGAPISGGGISNGPVHFMELVQTHTSVISQANVRRGNCAIYLDIDHPDIDEYLECREEGHPIQHVSLGVCISDAWMEEMIAGDKEKRRVWLRVLRKRFETGYPYLFFTDTVNQNAPQVYRDKGIRIHASNLCTEIALASNELWSFVCCLLSLNLLHYDEWKDSDLVETVTYFLDAVMSEYIEKTADEKLMAAAHRFAVDQRAIGIGTLGWHSYLQSKMLVFDSFEAKLLNIEIHKTIDERSLAASKQMALEYGEPPLLEGYGLRNTTRMAIAPTTSSSFILGQVSPSIEPLNSNYFTKDLAKGKFTYKNPYLQTLLAEYGRDDAETWRSILVAGGSVQHLDFLTDHERNVFKTFGEIDQSEIVAQAAHRQKFIDQAQSINLMIHPDTPLKDVNELMIAGWRMGVKSFYYQRSTNPAQEFVRSLLSCAACEA
ncbi:ribonucleoside-diphosphate reductase alpha chain [Faunimonas pinastri]|uniref:Ribonucleoside-diphosphate reductase alpha chain n=1 Tax=Faunimonas pinastri TaxID=1855383 RepID=A0A1H9MXI6_9HYPH|nr:ribonucleoside-diphosphate reductase subunit alpha [Faunimonas pinastri]SER28179.1 ribonucleoside-diphosphate reductase alpha chain [Faunimonas pinastri]